MCYTRKLYTSDTEPVYMEHAHTEHVCMEARTIYRLTATGHCPAGAIYKLLILISMRDSLIQVNDWHDRLTVVEHLSLHLMSS